MTKKVISPIWGLLDKEELECKYGFTQVIKQDQMEEKKEEVVELNDPEGLEALLLGE